MSTNIESIRTSATTTNAAAQERDAAVAEEQQAAADLLQQVIDLVRPSLRALGDRRLQSEYYVVDSNDDGKTMTRARYVILSADTTEREQVRVSHDDTRGQWISPVKYLALRDDGILVELDWTGSWTRWQHGRCEIEMSERVYSDALAAVQDGYPTVDEYIGRIAVRLEKAAPGLKASAEKARKTAARLRAVAELLRK